MENVLEKIKELLSSENQMMIRDSKGELHALQAGLKGEVIEVSGKDELYKLLWGKSRVGVRDIKELYDIVEKIKGYVMDNSSYQAKKKLESELK